MTAPDEESKRRKKADEDTGMLLAIKRKGARL